MTISLVVVAIAVTLVAAVTKLTSALSRTQAPARRSLWLTIACLVLAMTARLPQVGVAVNSAAGFNVRWPVNALLLMAAMYFFQMFFLYSVHGNDPSRVNGPRRWRLIIVLAFGVAILVLFLARPAATDFVFGSSGRYEAGGPGDHPAQLSRVLFALYMCFAALTLTYLGIRWAGKSGKGALQVGLGLFAVGSALGSLVAVHSAAYNLTVLAGIVPPWPEAIVVAWLIPLAATLQVAGVVIPAVWQRWVRLHRWFAHRRALITLYPLWATMCAVAPNVALDPIPTVWQDRTRTSEMDYRLYRRIIEIWDARTLLRPHMSRRVQEHAIAAGQRRGLDGDRLAAAVEAASIDAALRALRGNQTPAISVSPRDGRTSGDLAAEVAWWGSVAVEFRQLSAALAGQKAVS